MLWSCPLQHSSAPVAESLFDNVDARFMRMRSARQVCLSDVSNRHVQYYKRGGGGGSQANPTAATFSSGLTYNMSESAKVNMFGLTGATVRSVLYHSMASVGCLSAGMRASFTRA